MPAGSWDKGSYILQCYLDEIQQEQLLDADEEIKVSKRIKEGDREAFNQLLRSNLRFVVSVAKKYQNQGMSLEDLIAEGNLGLIKAAIRFDETRGFKFISYAVWWIKQSILEALSQKSRTVRLPMNRVDDIDKIRRTSRKLELEYEREPTLREVAKATEMSATAVAEVQQSAERKISMEESRTDEGDANLLQILSIEEESYHVDLMHKQSLRTDIKEALDSLTKREADIIRLYYGIGLENPMTLGKIGEKYNLTRERVRQIKADGLRKLRRPKTARVLQKYLG
ncbi:MAG: RNA polymerase sigma factor RpoD/SigA [Calditrichota bacterium]